MYKSFFIIVLVGLLFGLACNSPFIPKHKGYQSMEFPKKNYAIFNKPNYPYTFEFPVYAQIDDQVAYFGTDKKKDAWLNMRFPNYGATLYISYNKITKPSMIDTLVRDAYTFANNHNNKASFIEDSSFSNSNGVRGVFFHIGGDVATSYQFFVTDSSRHFFRGALYFDTTPNEDSLAPINAFLFKDMQHLVNSFRWK